MRRCHACSSSAPVLAVECSFVSGWDAGLQAVGDRNLAGGSMSRPRFLTVKSSSAEFIRPCCGQAYYGCHCHYFGPTVVGIGITPSVIFFGMVQSQEPDPQQRICRDSLRAPTFCCILLRKGWLFSPLDSAKKAFSRQTGQSLGVYHNVRLASYCFRNDSERA